MTTTDHQKARPGDARNALTATIERVEDPDEETQDAPPGTDRAWSPLQVAEYLRISVRHLHSLRRDDPTFPPAVMLGRSPRWHHTVIPAWLLRAGQRTTADEGGQDPDTTRAGQRATQQPNGDAHSPPVRTGTAGKRLGRV